MKEDKKQHEEKPQAPDELTQAKKEAAEYKDTLQRLAAEFENFKKRTDKENDNFKKYALASFIKSLLPIVDSFEMAVKSDEKGETYVKGVEMIYAQLVSFLEENGIKKIEAVGKSFDPYKHEVLLSEKSEKDNIVLEELQAGYMYNDTVLRNSKVKIGKNENRDNNAGQEPTKIS